LYLVNQSDDLDCYCDALVVAFAHEVGLSFYEKNMQEVPHVSRYLAKGDKYVEGVEAGREVLVIVQVSHMV
jgi:hypothetical protein